MKKAIALFALVFASLACNENKIIISQPAQCQAVPDAGSVSAQQPDSQPVSASDALIAPDVQASETMIAADLASAVIPDALAAEVGQQDALSAAVPDAQASLDTQPSEAGTVPKGFKILAVSVLKQDALGQAAEDVRAFQIGFSTPPSTAWITVNETFLGTNLVWEPIVLKGVTIALLASPGTWAQKLKPDTHYTWTITAASLDGSLSDTASGNFITSACFPGQTRTCYTGPMATRNIGRCHSGNESCVAGPNGLVWDGSCVGEVTPYPFGDRCGNGIDDDCDGKVDDSVKMSPLSAAVTWSVSTSSLDGEMLRFDMDATASGLTYMTWLNIRVEMQGAYSGFYRLNVMNEKGTWIDLSPYLIYYDASSGGYKAGMQDLGKNMYTGSNPNFFMLGIQWKDSGMTLNAGTITHFMLAGNLSVQQYGVGGTVVHSSPHSESSCPNDLGKTITVVP